MEPKKSVEVRIDKLEAMVDKMWFWVWLTATILFTIIAFAIMWRWMQ